MEELSKSSTKEMSKITDEISEYFLRMIEKDFSDIDFEILENRLKIKYMRDGHSAMFLDGRKGIRIIVDH